MKRSRPILLGVIVAATAVLVTVSIQDPSSNDTESAAKHSMGASPEGARISLVAGSVQMQFTDRTYIAVRGKRLPSLGKPVLVNGRKITVPEVDKSPEALGRAVFYQVDPDGMISDVMVLSRTRDQNGHLMPLQWLASKSGVEFVWPADGKRPWTVKRDNKTDEDNAHGYYLDSRPLNSPTRYEVTRSTPTSVTYKGKTTTEESSTTYVLIAPAYDDDLIGQPFDQAVSDKPTSPNPLQSAAAAGNAEVARFLEWNSFIGEDYVSSSFCGLLNDIAFYSGDDRGYSAVSAHDAFTPRGFPRSRISTRVGSSFAAGGSPDLNQEIYDNWIYKDVGTTHAYDKDKKLLSAANAGTAGIDVVDSYSTPDYAVRVVNVSIPNPLCKLGGVFDAPSVDYSYTYIALPDGYTAVDATFDQAPNTELMWQASSDTSDPTKLRGGCLYRYGNRGFDHLASVFPSEHVTIEMPDSSTAPFDCAVN